MRHLDIISFGYSMQIVYTTPDDAIGEVIDKVSRAMGISAIPAGPVAERLMNEFLGGKKDAWTKVTAKSKDADIKHLTPVQEEQEQLKELEKFKTPSQIKSAFDAMIRNHKLEECDKLSLLKEFVGQNNLCPTEIEVKGWCNLFKKAWNVKKDGKAIDVLEKLPKDLTPAPAQAPIFCKVFG